MKRVTKPRSVATLEVTVEYDELPDRLLRECIQEGLAHLHDYGRVTRANLTIPQPIVVDLTQNLTPDR